MNPELKYFLAVNQVPGIGPTRIRKALDHFGDAASFWHAKRTDLQRVEGFSEKLVEIFIKIRSELDIEKEQEKVLKSGYRALTIYDENYPQNLKNIYDPPPVLYTDGDILASDSKAIAIVGTRKPTHYGKEMARKTAEELSRFGFTIISGLAMGIDSEAHMGALEAGGRTIAVFGNGLDNVYPSINKELAERISGSGANVSEFPMGHPPDKWTFPQRNRIISGLSLGVVVIEGSLDSGALITARLGLEQGREVFAVPGSVRSEFSRGPHSLIKDGAKLVEGIDDILEELSIYVEKRSKSEPKDMSKLDSKEKKIMSVLSYEPRVVDNIIIESGFSASEVLKILSILELRNYVRRLPGKNYVLI
ncbi:DNA-processing protein DprA [Candidatus Margulisiibacteriota bacterium]